MAVVPPTTVSASIMPLVSLSALLEAYLAQTPPTRPSKRSPTQIRPINLNIGSLTHCDGSAVVKVGESTIVCGVRAEILPVNEIAHYRASENARNQDSPQDDGEDDEQSYEAVTLNSLLVPNLELSTNSHPSFPANVAPSTAAQSLSQRILSLLHSSRLVRASDLEIRHTSTADPSQELDPDDPAYIEPEKDVLKAYWVLYIDCVCLSFGGEGNVFDTAVMAVIAALTDTRLPQARWDEDEKKVFCSPDYEKARQLRLRGLPCPLSFGAFVPKRRMGNVNGDVKREGKQEKGEAMAVLLDTDSFEVDVCNERGNVVVDCSGSKTKVLRIEKNGGMGALDVVGTKAVLQAAEKRWHEWNQALSAAASAG